MADSSETPPSSRGRSWSRLRGKLHDLSAAAIPKKHDHDSTQNINDFLGKTASNSSDHSAPTSPASSGPEHRVLVPRINTLPKTSPVQPEWATRPEDLAAGKWRPTKPARRLGLAVSFDQRPTLIGEGGFSEDPPSLISKTSHAAGARPTYAVRPPSSENFAIRRKATTAANYTPRIHPDTSHETPRDPSPASQPRRPTLPDISITTTQPPVSNIPPLPAQSESHRDSSSYPHVGIRADLHAPPPGHPRALHPQLQVTDLPLQKSQNDPENSLRTPTSPSAQRIYEMRAEEGMAHRRSIRSVHDVPGPKPTAGHSPSSSVSSLDTTAQVAAGIASEESSRPASQHSRIASSPEPTAFQDATHYPLGKLPSAGSSRPYLSPPGSARGPQSSQTSISYYQNLVSRPATDASSRLARPHQGASLPEAAVLQDVAPPPYQPPPAISTSQIISPPPALAPQIAAKAPAPVSAPEEPPVHVTAAELPAAVAPRPRRPSNRNGLQFFEGQPLPPAPAMASPLPPPDMPVEKTAPHAEATLPSGRTLATPTAVPPPLQSPPYTASNVPPSFQTPPASGKPDTAPGVISTRSTAEKDAAAEQFTQFVGGASQVFHLSAASDGLNHSMLDWQYCALWWFLKGRIGLEDVAKGAFPPQDLAALTQHQVNIAKAFWIAQEVLSQQANAATSTAETVHIQQTIDAVTSGILSLCASMKKRDILPPAQFIVSGVDQTIWTSQPFDQYPSEWINILNGSPFTKGGRSTRAVPIEAFPTGDSRSIYCYGRVFAKAFVSLRDEDPTLPPFKCVLTVTRKLESPELEVVVSSQDTQALINIRTLEDMGVHWEHTSFEHDRHSLVVKLPHKVSVLLMLSPRDYTWLWSCYDNSMKITRSLRPRSDEHLMQTFDLAAFAYRDSARADEFPDQRIEHCRIAVFERHYKPEDHANRKTHRGYRLAVMTTTKLVRNVQFTVGMKAPLQYSTSQSKPDCRMQLNEMDRGRSALLSFNSFETRDFFADMITGRMLATEEGVMHSFPIKNVKAGAVKAGITPEQWTSLRFKELLIIDEDYPEDPQHKLSSCDMSERLRIMMVNSGGTCVDRLCDAFMDVRVRLDAGDDATLQVMRPGAREDLTVAIGPEDGAEGYLRHLFDTVTSVASAFAYTFNSLESMHAFEQAITGHRVLYDCVPSAFVITRRQMYVGKDKNWQTRSPRVQLVERDGRFQLLAFFHDYIVADCLNFEVKRTDTFEQTVASKSAGHGIHGLKLVDAKFTLPGSNKDDWLREGAERDATAKYTNLAAEEYAAEHDDILVYFDSEEERDRFGDFLPAPVTRARSKFNLMRRI